MFLFQYKAKSPADFPLPNLEKPEKDLAKRIENICSWVSAKIAQYPHDSKKQAVYDALGNLDACRKKVASSVEPEDKGKALAELQSGLNRLILALSSTYASTEVKQSFLGDLKVEPKADKVGGKQLYESVFSGNFDPYFNETLRLSFEGTSKSMGEQKLSKMGDELWLNSQVGAYNDWVESEKKRIAPEIRGEWEKSRGVAPSTTSITSVGPDGLQHSTSFHSELGEKYRQLNASLLGVTHEPEKQAGVFFTDADHSRADNSPRVDLQSSILASMPPDKLSQLAMNTAGIFEGLGDLAVHMIPFKDAVFTMVDGALMIFKKDGDGYKGTGLVLEGFALALMDYAFLRGVVTLKAIEAGKVGMKEWGRAFKKGLEEGAFKFEGNKLVLSGFNGAEKYTTKIAGNTWEFSNSGGKLFLAGPKGKAASVNITEKAFAQLRQANSVFSEITASTATIESFNKKINPWKEELIAYLEKNKADPHVTSQLGSFIDRLAQGEKFDSIIQGGLQADGEIFQIVRDGSQFMLKGQATNKYIASVDQALTALQNMAANPEFSKLVASNVDALANLKKLGLYKFENPIVSGTSWGWKSPRTYKKAAQETSLAGLKGDEEKVVNGVLVKNEFKLDKYQVDGRECVVKEQIIGGKKFIVADFNGRSYSIEPDNAKEVMAALNSKDGKKATKLFNKYMRIGRTETLASFIDKKAAKVTDVLGEKLEFVTEETAKNSWTASAKGTIYGRLPAKYGGQEEKFQFFLLTTEGARKFMEKYPRAPVLWMPTAAGRAGNAILYAPEALFRLIVDAGADAAAGGVKFAKWLGTKEASSFKETFQKAWLNVVSGHPVATTVPYLAEKFSSQYFIYDASGGESAQNVESALSKLNVFSTNDAANTSGEPGRGVANPEPVEAEAPKNSYNAVPLTWDAVLQTLGKPDASGIPQDTVIARLVINTGLQQAFIDKAKSLSEPGNDANDAAAKQEAAMQMVHDGLRSSLVLNPNMPDEEINKRIKIIKK